MKQATLALALLVGLAATVRAEDAPSSPPSAPPIPAAPSPSKPTPPPTPEQAADAVLAAIASKDDATLRALSSKDAPDPWLVADELIRREQHDAAEAFAKAAPRVDVELLPAYVASRRGKPDDPARRERLAKANVALQIRKPADALDVLGPDESAVADMVGVRLAAFRGRALSDLVRLEAAAAAYVAAGEAAERLGWWSEAGRALYLAGVDACGTSAFLPAQRAFERCRSVAEKRADAVGAAVALGALGLVHESTGELAKALAAYERALPALEAAGARRDAARTHNGLGNVYWRLGDYRRALESYERSLAGMESSGDRAGAALALANIGLVHKSRGNFPKALEFYERALAEQERLGDRGGSANTLGNIGNVHSVRGEFEKAVASYERALAVMEAVGDRPGAARTLANIGLVHQSRGDYAKALSCYEQALAVNEALGARADAAATLGCIGDVQGALGDHARALATLSRALEALDAVGDRAGAALTLRRIGLVHRSRGDFAKARSTLERARAAYEALEARAAAVQVLAELGSVHHALGDVAKALSTLERALPLQEALGDRTGAVATLGNMGFVYASIGAYEQARVAFERVRATSEAMGSKADTLKALAALVDVNARLGDTERALEAYRRGIAIAEATGDKRGDAALSNAAGILHESLGEPAKALEAYGRALAASESLGLKSGVATALVGVGGMHLVLGDLEEAIKTLDRAARVAEKVGDTGVLVLALSHLAQARLTSGDPGRATESAHKAVSLLKTLVGGLGDEQGSRAREQHVRLFATGLAAAAQAGDVAEAAFFLESGRAGSMLESLDARDTLRRASLPEPLRLAEEEARAFEARALAASVKSQDSGDLATIRAAAAALDDARARTAEVVERIQREAKHEARLWYPVATPVEDLQQFLRAEEALVLYGLAAPDAEAHALVLTRGEARIVALGRSGDILAACEAFDPTDRDEDSAALERLRALLVRSLGLPKEVTRLLVSPEGPLGYVPFAALLPEIEIAYQPSGTTYGVLLEEAHERGNEVLALGDPDYEAKYDATALGAYARPLAAAGAMRGGRLVSLPGTRAEATAVGGVTLLGRDASEAGLRGALEARKGRWRSVHFACHGLVNPDRPTLSSLALTPDATGDGFLTVLEVFQMRIPADLVVLSACETGKGRIVGGEGIVGLTRAFMFAGSPRVLCSLWKVDDEATSALMTKFYELWNPKDGKPGLPTAEALRRAQEHVRSQEKWKHPYYWAAWVLWGLPS